MNLNQLVERTRNLTGIRLQSIRSDDQIRQVLNESYQEVLSLFAWPFLRTDASLTLSAGDDEFETPVTFRYLTAVSAGTKRLRQTTLDALDEAEDKEAEPELYARVTDRTIRVWPTPEVNVTITLRGQIEYDPLGGSDEPEFAEQFHPVVAYRAASRLLLEEGDDSGRSEAYERDFAGYVQRMQDYYMSSGDISLIRIGSRRRR